MFTFNTCLYILSYLSLLYLHCVCKEDTTSCHGSIIAGNKIDFSRIKVQLYTTKGDLTFEETCDSYGSFLIPDITNKGKYILKVAAPPGWSFEQSQVDLNIDGKSDQCSKSENIFFKFTGYTLTGQVTVSYHSHHGQSGVTLDLFKSGSTKPLKSTQSIADGSYTFEEVLPGEYTVKASRDPWIFTPSVVICTITKDNCIVKPKIKLYGYDVKGQVKSMGKPMKGVAFLLLYNEEYYTEHSNLVRLIDSACDSSALKQDTSGHAICAVYSNDQGIFTFPSIPPKRHNDYYRVVPSYQNEHLSFDWTPKENKLEKINSSIDLEQSFEVKSFTIHGMVLDSKRSFGISRANIKVNGKFYVTGNTDGSYELKDITFGQHLLVEAFKSGLVFKPLNITFNSPLPQLPPILGSKKLALLRGHQDKTNPMLTTRMTIFIIVFSLCVLCLLLCGYVRFAPIRGVYNYLKHNCFDSNQVTNRRSYKLLSSKI